MKITVFGGSGRTGLLLIKQLLANGHSVVAYTRRPEKIAFSHPELRLVTGRLAEPETIDATVAGSDAVFSLLGPTSKTRGPVIAEATKCIIRSMHQHGVKRFLVTATPVFRAPEDHFRLNFYLGSLLIKYFQPDAFQNLIGVGKLVTGSGLDWTLVRIPWLTDAPEQKNVKAGFVGDAGVKLRPVSRHDLVTFLIAQLDSAQFAGKAPVLSSV
jgi:uncharacterized protein YbjT (DUF2867 family)